MQGFLAILLSLCILGTRKLLVDYFGAVWDRIKYTEIGQSLGIISRNDRCLA